VAPTPPPDIDLPAWKTSLDRIRGLEADRFYLAHFGAVDDPTWHLDALETHLDELEQWVRGRIASEPNVAVLGADLRDRTRAESARITGADGPALAAAYELAAPSWMNIDGLRRYLTTVAAKTEIPR
jgi:hypothetical protein